MSVNTKFTSCHVVNLVNKHKPQLAQNLQHETTTQQQQQQQQKLQPFGVDL